MTCFRLSVSGDENRAAIDTSILHADRETKMTKVDTLFQLKNCKKNSHTFRAHRKKNLIFSSWNGVRLCIKSCQTNDVKLFNKVRVLKLVLVICINHATVSKQKNFIKVLAVRAGEYGPLNWPITARVLTWRYNNISYWTIYYFTWPVSFK